MNKYVFAIINIKLQKMQNKSLPKFYIVTYSNILTYTFK